MLDIEQAVDFVRKQFPKQFLALTGDQTLFQQTLERLVFDGMDAPIVVCNKEHRFIVNEQLANRNLDTQRILMEPFGRNTAPAVALTAMMLKTAPAETYQQAFLLKRAKGHAYRHAGDAEQLNWVQHSMSILKAPCGYVHGLNDLINDLLNLNLSLHHEPLAQRLT